MNLSKELESTKSYEKVYAGIHNFKHRPVALLTKIDFQKRKIKTLTGGKRAFAITTFVRCNKNKWNTFNGILTVHLD